MVSGELLGRTEKAKSRMGWGAVDGNQGTNLIYTAESSKDSMIDTSGRWDKGG